MPRRGSPENLDSFRSRLRDGIDHADDDTRHRVLRALVREVLVGPDRVVIRHCIPFRPLLQSLIAICVGGVTSPLLANVYLHYVLDLWVRQCRSRQGRADVVFVRFADDFVAGFEYEADAQQFLADLRERFAKFGLELHPDKTRLIEFGRHAVRARAARNVGKPETFDFLGFTHICGKTKSGRFWVKRKTMAKRMRAKLVEVNTHSSNAGTSQSPSRGYGWQAWSEATSPITPCLATLMLWRLFVPR